MEIKVIVSDKGKDQIFSVVDINKYSECLGSIISMLLDEACLWSFKKNQVMEDYSMEVHDKAKAIMAKYGVN